MPIISLITAISILSVIAITPTFATIFTVPIIVITPITLTITILPIIPLARLLPLYHLVRHRHPPGQQPHPKSQQGRKHVAGHIRQGRVEQLVCIRGAWSRISLVLGHGPLIDGVEHEPGVEEGLQDLVYWAVEALLLARTHAWSVNCSTRRLRRGHIGRTCCRGSPGSARAHVVVAGR